MDIRENRHRQDNSRRNRSRNHRRPLTLAPAAVLAREARTNRSGSSRWRRVEAPRFTRVLPRGKGRIVLRDCGVSRPDNPRMKDQVERWSSSARSP
ncbi:hypothetical protein VNO77_44607 [Canavalia gladiata]|uniref:Uncharacterized protein n=1 Tax=Canavalia gladiata TaxID=3824 RepID=A0AAN9JW86_CANGL